MVDNELNLKINTEADKSKVEELSTAIEKVTENSEMQVKVQMNLVLLLIILMVQMLKR